MARDGWLVHNLGEHLAPDRGLRSVRAGEVAVVSELLSERYQVVRDIEPALGSEPDVMLGGHPGPTPAQATASAGLVPAVSLGHMLVEATLRKVQFRKRLARLINPPHAHNVPNNS